MKKTLKTKKRKSKKTAILRLQKVLWIAVPTAITALIFLDALGLYCFTTVRLAVVGVDVLVVLLPFFSEIKIKDVTFKRNTKK